METVVLDACVLYPAPLRDFQLALRDVFRARWTNEIHDEWIRNVLKNRPDLKIENLERTRDLMNSHVRDCLVKGYKSLIPGISLPDPNDRHVVAAAVKSGATIILSFNIRDFPSRELRRHHCRAIHPDAFLLGLLRQAPHSILVAAKSHWSRLKNPPKTFDEYCDALERCGLKETAAIFRIRRDEIIDLGDGYSPGR